MPLPSRAISHARGHLRASRFARRTTEKRERLFVVYCQAYANFKPQTRHWEGLTVFSQQILQEPWIPENSSRPLTEFLQFQYRSSTRLSRWSRYKKEEKVLVGSKSMRCEAQIARFWLLRVRVSQSLRAHSQTRTHWVESRWEVTRISLAFVQEQALVLGRQGIRNSAIKLITEILSRKHFF